VETVGSSPFLHSVQMSTLRTFPTLDFGASLTQH
jgi:hypothetical protein